MTNYIINHSIIINYEKIKNGTYKWTEAELNEIITLSKFALKDFNLKKQDFDDEVSNALLLFFEKIIKYYNVNSKVKLSSYFIYCVKKNFVRKICKSHNKELSLEEIAENINGNYNNLQKFITNQSFEKSSESKIYYENLLKIVKKYEILNKRYVLNQSTVEIAKEKGLTHPTISKKTKKELKNFIIEFNDFEK